MHDTDETILHAAEPMAPGVLGGWWRQGARTALFQRPDWRGLQATPTLVALLVAVPFLVGVLLQRLYITGAASFYWPALQMGWLSVALTAWTCWWLVPRHDQSACDCAAPSAAALFAMLAAQSLVLSLAPALILLPMVRTGLLAEPASGAASAWLRWLAWLLPMAWVVAAQMLLLWRASERPARQRGAAMALLSAVFVAGAWLQPLRLWYPDEPTNAAASPAPMQLTQELFEDQAATLDLRLAAIAPQRPGLIDVYAITFAPYADEDVFLRESRMVAGVMAERFDAAGRTVQLVNHRSTLREWPWATPLNLQRTIEHIARRMDRNEDILFIHLTSHGARSGSLAAGFWPLSTDSLTPAMLKAALDAAGIRHRILSISACYSGSWIEPLADEHTLVMTAADADHTSYGCGRKSELTYFGRAMYDEQLRSQTLSFETAHAAARRVIDEREKQAGKDDGYSNPQIRVGAAMREHLLRLERQRAAAPR